MGSSQQSDWRDLSDSSSPADNFLSPPPALSHQCLCQPGEHHWSWTHYILVDCTPSDDLTYKTKYIADLLLVSWCSTELKVKRDIILTFSHWTSLLLKDLIHEVPCPNTVSCVFICLGDGCGWTFQCSRWSAVAALKSLPLPSSPIQHSCGSLSGHADTSNAL